MNMWARFSGIAGAVLVLFGLLGGIIANSFAIPLISFHLILGVLLLGFYALKGMGRIGNFTQMVVGRRGRFASNVVLYTVVFVGILCVINFFVSRNDKRWDLTEEGVYSLSKQSISLVQGLKKPLKLIGIGDNPNVDENQMTDLFALYKYHNKSLVTTEMVSPRTKPQLLDTYGMKPGNVVYIEYGSGETKQVSRLNEFSEEAITNAVLKLTRGEAKKVYYVQGHDELALDGAGPEGIKNLADAIGDEHLTVSGLLLSRAPAVPTDAAAVVLMSPKKPLLPEERAMLIKYAEDGGRLLLLGDPRTTTDIKEIAAHFGIEVGNNVVIDQIQRLFAGPTLGAQPIVMDYPAHPITKTFTKESVTIFNIASTVKVVGKSDATTTYTDLLKSSATAWGETNLQRLFDSEDATAVLEPDDIQGPVSLAAVYEKKLDAPKSAEQKHEDSERVEMQKTARVVVFGDADWVMNQNINIYANRDLILNALNWVVGEEGGVTIRAKSIRASTAPIPLQTYLLIMASSFVVPELILLFGLYIWWRRKTLLA